MIGAVHIFSNVDIICHSSQSLFNTWLQASSQSSEVNTWNLKIAPVTFSGISTRPLWDNSCEVPMGFPSFAQEWRRSTGTGRKAPLVGLGCLLSALTDRPTGISNPVLKQTVLCVVKVITALLSWLAGCCSNECLHDVVHDIRFRGRSLIGQLFNEY